MELVWQNVVGAQAWRRLQNMLGDDQNLKSKKICSSLFHSFNNDKFVNHVTTCEETWTF